MSKRNALSYDATASAGLFSAMKPTDVSLETDYDGGFFSSSYFIEASYGIMLPVRMLFAKDWIVMRINTRVEMPVSNVTELIRNTDMVEDYLEQFGLTEGYQKGLDKIKEAIGKVKSMFT